LSESFPLGSVWEADADASDGLTTFVIVEAREGWRVAFALCHEHGKEFATHMFDFHVDWPFCLKCVRVA
jgi:hypothetical protein